ncbi:hypothetical protein GCK32_008960 [Trichostrongylus colubriformis]|uniref:Uncharacterized protein n=1 Tax=Trichostrongylus colubriformis TaxID=6319 RepID=A0AAN8FN86_TRICO
MSMCMCSPYVVTPICALFPGPERYGLCSAFIKKRSAAKGIEELLPYLACFGRSKAFKAYSKLTQLHSEWQLLQNDRAERTVFDEYISKYGDYREIISSSAKQLEQLDLLMNEIDKSYPERNLPVPSNSSGADSYDNTGTDRELHERPRHQPCHFLPRPEVCSNNQSTMHLLNFVDASILSKLELPTFDGNLLEYPEFSARFATLVGDKPQLDNVTKLSLLKSCLRGRALQSIEGLSMTAGNYG